MAKIFVPDIAVTSLDMITAFELASAGGAFMFAIDELQDATLSQTEDKVDITGKQGRKLTTLKRNKAVTISGTNGLVSSNLLAAQVGDEFENDPNAPVMWCDILTVNSNAATLNYKAQGSTGNEVAELYVKDSSGAVTKKLEQDASVAAGKFTYNAETKALAFNNGEIADGTEIAVYYKRYIDASVLQNLSDHYSAKCQMYIDATGEDTCGNVYHIQFYIPKADFSGQFDLALGGDQTTHAFEAEALAGSCGTAGVLWTYTVFGANTADATGAEGTTGAEGVTS